VINMFGFYNFYRDIFKLFGDGFYNFFVGSFQLMISSLYIVLPFSVLWVLVEGIMYAAT